jgi:hypothetical protein
MLGMKDQTGVMANDGKPFKRGEPMQSTCRPAAAGKSHLKRDFKIQSRPAHYFPAIALVAASLLGVGSGLQAQSAAPPDAAASTTDTAAPAPVVPKVFKNELGVTADFMYGEGTITLPIGYSLAKALPGGNLAPQVITADRSTLYYGGTISYSYGRSWYLDLSYENGNSTGTQTINFQNTLLNGVPGSQNASFNYSDDWYQLYLRYNFQNWLAGTRFKAYLRGGVSLVDATLSANIPGYYSQTDDTRDILGNLGFGLTYTVYAKPRFKVGLQVEGEGSFGERSQQSTEDLPLDFNLSTSRANINNTLYGGIGRATVHADWRVGHSGRWRVTGDLGVQAKYTIIDYPNGGGSPDEYLWGPYVKIGASYVF